MVNGMLRQFVCLIVAFKERKQNCCWLLNYRKPILQLEMNAKLFLIALDYINNAWCLNGQINRKRLVRRYKPCWSGEWDTAASVVLNTFLLGCFCYFICLFVQSVFDLFFLMKQICCTMDSAIMEKNTWRKRPEALLAMTRYFKIRGL